MSGPNLWCMLLGCQDLNFSPAERFSRKPPKVLHFSAGLRTFAEQRGPEDSRARAPRTARGGFPEGGGPAAEGALLAAALHPGDECFRTSSPLGGSMSRRVHVFFLSPLFSSLFFGGGEWFPANRLVC